MALKQIFVGALSMVLLLVATPASGASELEKLVRRADMVYRGKTSAAVLRMEVKTKDYERKFKIVAWQDSRKKVEKSLIKILGPAAWRGHATLKIGDKLKLYNPKTNHVQVVGSSMLGNSWMGSHFTNDDLVKETKLAKHFSLSLISKKKKKAPVGGTATWYRIKMLPKKNAPVAWGRIEYALWANDKAIVPVSAKYFRKKKDSKAARTIKFTEVKKLAGRHLPAVMTMRLASKPGEYTRITYKKLKLNVDIPASKFTEQAMKK